jgi:hypothetical protein
LIGYPPTELDVALCMPLGDSRVSLSRYKRKEALTTFLPQRLQRVPHPARQGFKAGDAVGGEAARPPVLPLIGHPTAEIEITFSAVLRDSGVTISGHERFEAFVTLLPSRLKCFPSPARKFFKLVYALL